MIVAFSDAAVTGADHEYEYKVCNDAGHNKSENISDKIRYNRMYPASVLATRPNACQSDTNLSERYKYSEVGVVSILF